MPSLGAVRRCEPDGNWARRRLRTSAKASTTIAPFASANSTHDNALIAVTAQNRRPNHATAATTIGIANSSGERFRVTAGT